MAPIKLNCVVDGCTWVSQELEFDLASVLVDKHVAAVHNLKEEGKEILENLDMEISSWKKEVQNNKQMISDLHQNSTEEDSNMFRLEKREDVVSASWTDEELLLGVQGVRMCGKNFSDIASILGTKTAEQVETFFDTYKLEFDLDKVLEEGGFVV